MGGSLKKGTGGTRTRESAKMIDMLPEEVVLEILTWVPAVDLARSCRLVCSSWCRIIDSQDLWHRKCEMEVPWSGRLGRHRPPDWQRFHRLRPIGRNMTRNPCARRGFRDWTITTDGGDGWKVEHVEVPLPEPHQLIQQCFVSSYQECTKKQIIDLLAEGLWEVFLDNQPDIVVSEWYAARWDCGCLYKLCCRLLAADQKTVIVEKTVQPEAIPQWNDGSWRKAVLVLEHYGPGARYLEFEHSGKDTQFWAGWYGSRMTLASVMVVPPGASHEVIEDHASA
uniref:F-box only protein 44-like n=1 Tax=Myxine glutinosa TaxID=7769 RepID=UPI00358E721C